MVARAVALTLLVTESPKKLYPLAECEQGVFSSEEERQK